MKDNEHLTKAGLEKILSIKAVLNRGLSDKLAKEFPQISPIEGDKNLIERFFYSCLGEWTPPPTKILYEFKDF